MRHVVGRHNDKVRPRSGRPGVEILPFQKAIERPPQVEGERVTFDAEQQDLLRRRSEVAYRAGERALFALRFQPWMLDMNHPTPRGDNADARDGCSQHKDSLQLRRNGQVNALADATEKERHSRICWHQIIGTLETGERQQADHHDEPKQPKTRLAV